MAARDCTSSLRVVGLPAYDRFTDDLADGGGNFRCVHLDGVGIVGGEDEAGDAVFRGDLGDLLRPLLRRADEESSGLLGKLAVDIEHATDGGGFAPGLLRAIIDVLVHLGESGRAAFEVAEGGEPAVGGAAGQAEDARLVGADPDADVVGRFRAAPGAVDLVELAVDARATLLVRVPDLAHDLDPFLAPLH